jgi:hypothetical protein
MIRFKKAVAADVPLPAAGYLTLFVDVATGEPSVKDDTGAIATLKGTTGDPGTGIPEGGTVGQVVTKAEGGPIWADPSGGDAPAGAWMNLLPPDGSCVPVDGGEGLPTALITGDIDVSGGH